MTRPHIEFIHAQVLPWQAGILGGALKDVEAKVLSRDSDSGAASMVLRFPAGWSHGEPFHLAAAEEFVVLEGDLTVNGVDYTEFAYANFPAGHPRNAVSSKSGAVLLSFFDGVPEVEAGAGASGAADGFIEKIDVLREGWDPDYSGIDSPELAAAGARKKILRSDPGAGDQTWFIGTLPLWRERKTESHPVIQEMYLLSGSISGNTGVMHTGAYFWRPADILHGPYGSKTGNVILMRSQGGALATDYYEPDPPFSFDAPHRPVLPLELEELGREPWAGGGRY